MAKDKSMGALWKHTMKDGKTTFLAGNVEVNGEKFKIVVFKNERKNGNDKAPDYRILPALDAREADDEGEAPF